MMQWLSSECLPVLVLVVFAALELIAGDVPAASDDASRWKVNLGLFVIERFGQFALAGAVLVIVAPFARYSPLAWLVGALPWWGRIAAAVVVLDAVAYAMHVVSHKVPLLWRLHAVHHADPALDVTTSVRHHPIELLPGTLAFGAVIALVGFQTGDLVVYATLAFMIQALAHARLRLTARAATVVGWIFVTPGIHAVHHSPIRVETDSNYGELFSVWDRLLGTFRSPAGQPARFGLDQYAAARFQSLGGALTQPFVRAETGPDHRY
jgi:sterol desaturase/sphingolipid hydroxylase (fatty acid hydroxylase superfamily)